MKELSPEQVARMRPEARERYEQRLKIVKRNRKILGIGCAVIAAVAVIVLLSITVLFNISSIKVGKPSEVYTADQIIMASGLTVGDNMVLTNFHKVEERIEKSLPYIKDAVVSGSASGKVVITVTDAAASIVVQADNGYVIADADSKVLEIVPELPEDNALMVLKLNGGITYSLGENFVLNDAEENDLYNVLSGYLDSSGLLGKITKMDLTDSLSLKLIYQGRVRLLLGTSDNMDEKIKSAAKVLEQEDAQNPELIAEINLTIPKKVFVNPLESLYPQEEEEIPVPEEGADDAESEGTAEDESADNGTEETTSEPTSAQEESSTQNTQAQTQE